MPRLRQFGYRMYQERGNLCSRAKEGTSTLEARLSEYEKGQSDKSGESRDVENDEQSSDGDNIHQIIPTFSTDPATDFNNSSAWLPAINTDLLPAPTNLTSGVEDPSSSLMFQSPNRLPIEALLIPLVCSDLDKLYFDRVHVFAPLLHKVRYFSWSKQVDKPKQKLCLQYAMWTMTACFSSQFQMIRHELYTETRRLLDTLEIESQDTPVVGIEQPQAWLLLSIYEMISDQFKRGLVSAGRAFRLVQLMGLYKVDRQLPAGFQGDWVDKESMRRTFWVAYILDRFTSLVDGLPLSFDEREIGTVLPSPDPHFMNGQPIDMCYLHEVTTAVNTGRSSGALSRVEICPFAESAIMATICGRVLSFRRQFMAEYGGQGLAPGFYQQYQSVNALLVDRLQMLSQQVASSQGQPNPILIFLAITAHMAIFMLCETIESKQLIPGSPEAALASSKQRSLDGAGELGMLITILSQLNHFEVGSA
ncbi:MAG: hypothetical protein Q9157_002565 [Trypethelium eluteriae]